MSTYDQVASPKRQQDMILARAEIIQAETGAQWGGCRTDEGTSATKIRWNDRKKRPELNKLLDAMEPGDHLILWRLDRLERSMFGMVRALEFLVDRGIQIHVLDLGGMQLDLTTATGRMFVVMMGALADMWSEQHSATVRADFKWRKANGLAYSPYPPPGHVRRKRKYTGGKRTQGRDHDLLDIWDEAQCELIRELFVRRAGGEPMQKIADDFYARKLKRGDGAPWVFLTKRKALDHPTAAVTRLNSVYWWHMERLSRGLDLQDLPCSEEVQKWAVSMLANKRVQVYGRNRKRGG